MPWPIEGPLLGAAGRCEPVLRALPDWFGVESSVQEYARIVDSLPTFIAQAGGETVGFLALKRHNPFAAEIYVMGVRCDYHRRGIGRALLAAAEAWLAAERVEFLQVKMLGPSMRHEPHERTRAFYAAVGFRPLQEFARLWESQPCLQMVKRLGEAASPPPASR